MDQGVVVLKSQKKEEMLKEVFQKLNESTQQVHFCVRPTLTVLAAVLTAAPNVKVITCPPSLYHKVPQKICTALEEVGVKFKPMTRESGRPATRSDSVIRRIFELKDEGCTAKKISEKLGIPLTTVYYYLKGKGRRRRDELIRRNI